MAKIVLTKKQAITILHKFDIETIDGVKVEELTLPTLKEYFKTFQK